MANRSRRRKGTSIVILLHRRSTTEIYILNSLTLFDFKEFSKSLTF
ncbi:unnamed protein product, partial [Brassica rapa subsp. trilocularis]